MLHDENATIFSVSRLNTTVRKLLEHEMGRIWLTAEISNFTRPSSGHWYFTLKDDNAQVRSAMFRSSNQRVSFRPQNGQQVLVRASVTLYDPRGDYQLIVESMQPAGEGLLQQQFTELKSRLQAEGLFAAEYKQPLPSPARQVGVITSATGAALHDILQVLRRRDPSLPVIIYPTAVQGNEAVPAIVRAIELANQRNECDILIVGRGGGSLEDLWCFNDERVARAIFASRLPVVSAVGHETDITICDFVADLRAPTPSAAAELISRNQTELLRQLLSAQQQMEMAMDYYLARRQRSFSQLQHRLHQQHPQLRLTRQQNLLLQQQRQLQAALQQQLQKHNLRFEQLSQRLQRHQPQPLLYQAAQDLSLVHYRLRQAMEKQLNGSRQRFGTLAVQLESASPLATLARGFSVTTSSNGDVIKNTRQLQRGDTLRTRLNDGWVESEVTATMPVSPAKKTRKPSSGPASQS
ncbi:MULTISPECIES: exodeoxyribonuclease VII large subunit [Tatumella]|uniref:Exodeoxyribonuclease 7 large subunit n=1 Tax=Tatumella punctata TaxID=399969 RepID=A0ABW1VTC1_9GAMM|nr:MULTISPECIES: exodeoxyribonuclease VII large subunit [unclassified Tatumella]MBS0856931.1 exodeoxyribonuclease VII large subunit [Tatumella sp. JGM16]MBS0893881.1 exodeoxyribonuclease VII large subunit [Tatumella sp. JGM130]MBS0913726.1 exodeoxyribonuclease VII large subunit [Tatumella sp. JGM91]